MTTPDAAPTLQFDPPLTGEKAYQLLRNTNSAAIRDIRAALNLGICPKLMCKNYRGTHRDIVVAAVQHMVAHPELGVVRWISGNQYIFVTEEPDHA